MPPAPPPSGSKRWLFTAWTLRALAGLGVGRLALVAADDDWTQVARLELANYALSRAAGAPPDIFCATRGTKEGGCHCWNDQCNPMTNGNDCNEPVTCLIYSTQDDGNLLYAKLNASQDVHQTLSNWSVPAEMVQSFDLALLTENATFTTFDFTVNSATSHFEAHVGTARLYQEERFLGYTYGKSDADLVQPYCRTVKAGDCHGTQRGQHPRGYRTDEITRIEAGVASTAFKTAASKAAPPVAEEPHGGSEANFPEQKISFV